MPQPGGKCSATETGSGVRFGSVRKNAGGTQPGKCCFARLAAEISLRLAESWGFCAISMTDTDFPGIAKRRAEILGDLAAIAETPPMLVAVTKTQSDAALEEILAAGSTTSTIIQDKLLGRGPTAIDCKILQVGKVNEHR